MQEIKKTNKKVLSVLVPYKHWTKKIQRLCEGKNNFAGKERKYSALCKMKTFWRNQSCKNFT